MEYVDDECLHHCIALSRWRPAQKKKRNAKHLISSKHFRPLYQMTLILVLIFFKSVCLYLQNIVLCCYDKFLNPRRKYLHHSSSGSASSNLPLSPWSWFASSSSSTRGNRSSLLTSSSSALSKARALEREQLLEQIRARKRTKARSKAH